MLGWGRRSQKRLAYSSVEGDSVREECGRYNSRAHFTASVVLQIVHGLRSGGDMSFDELSTVIPCIEMAYDAGYKDLDKHQGFLPKVFKTHTWYQDCPKAPTKCIFIVRCVTG